MRRSICGIGQLPFSYFFRSERRARYVLEGENNFFAIGLKRALIDLMLNDKRTATRFNGRIGVYARDQDGLNFGFITNLSRHGAYIETEKIVTIGGSYQFVLSNGVITAPVTSSVVRCRDAFFEGGRSGMAVSFFDLSNLAKRLRDDLLLYLMNNHHQDIWAQSA